MFDTQYRKKFLFRLKEKKSLAFSKSKENIGKNEFDILQVIENPSDKQGRVIDMQINLSHKVKLNMVANYDATERGRALFVLEPGTYETVTIPENIQTLW